MKVPLAIFLGCLIVAVALYLGLTYDKRSWMNACLEHDAAEILRGKPPNLYYSIQYSCERMYRVK